MTADATVAAPGSRACTSRSATLEVLRGIDLDVAEHEVVCLIGASGSGKSTLLRCINLLEPIDAGRIVVEGDEITAPGRRRRPHPAADRHRLPGVQPVPAHVRPRQRDAGAAQGPRQTPRAEAEARGDRAAGPVRPGRQARRVPRPPVRRPAAAGGDRPGAGDAARPAAARRGHERARPGARRRGPQRHPRAGGIGG